MSDLHQRSVANALIFSMIQNYPNVDLDEWKCGWMHITQINRVEAIRVLEILPHVFLDEESLSRDELRIFLDMCDHCLAIAVGHMSKVTSFRDPRLDGEWKVLEPFITLSQIQYELIDAVFNRVPDSQKMFGTSACMWLFSEASMLRQMLATAGLAAFDFDCPAVKGKRAYYDSINIRDREFSIPDPSAPLDCEPLRTIPELLNFCDKGIVKLAYDIAARDSDFDKMYYKPFLTAGKRLNRYINKNKLFGFESLATPKGKPRIGNHKIL